MSGTWTAGWVVGDIVPATEFQKAFGCFYDHTTSGTDASLTVTLPTWGADVRFVFDLASNTGGDLLTMQVNGDTGGNYYQESFYASGATPFEGDTAAATSAIVCTLPSAANYSVGGEILVPNFRGTAFFKRVILSVLSETGAGANLRTRRLDAFSWHNAAALTSVLFKPLSGSFITGSRIRGYVSG